MATIDHQAFFIGGSWTKAQSDDRFDIISPRSEEVIGHVPAASRADIDDAVAAARKAFDEGEWPRLTPAERADYLTRMADAIVKRQDELAELITEELGCTLFLSQVYQVVSPVMSLNYNAEIGRGLDTSQVRVSNLGPLATGSEGGSIIPMAGASLVVQEPVGVVAAVCRGTSAVPGGAAEARAGADAGCTAVLKVSPESNPLAPSSRRDRPGDRAASGRAQHPRRADREVSDTWSGIRASTRSASPARWPPGSEDGGRPRRADQAVTLELGGKSAASCPTTPTWRRATGPRCHASDDAARLRRPDPLLVPGARYDEFAERAFEAASALKVGDPLDPRHGDRPAGDRAAARPRRGLRRDRPAGGRQGIAAAVAGREPRPRLVRRADAVRRRRQLDAHRPRGDLRAGDSPDALRRRGGRDPDRQRLRLRPLRRGVDRRRRARLRASPARCGPEPSRSTPSPRLRSPFGGYKKSGIGREFGPTATTSSWTTR